MILSPVAASVMVPCTVCAHVAKVEATVSAAAKNNLSLIMLYEVFCASQALVVFYSQWSTIIFSLYPSLIVLCQESQLALHLFIGQMKETCSVVVLLPVADNPLEELVDVGVETVIGETNVFYWDEVDVFILD